MYKFIFAYKCINIYLYYAKQKPIIKLRWKNFVFLMEFNPLRIWIVALNFADYIPKIKKNNSSTLILLKKCITLNRNWFELKKLNPTVCNSCVLNIYNFKCSLRSKNDSCRPNHNIFCGFVKKKNLQNFLEIINFNENNRDKSDYQKSHCSTYSNE
jgi:hypothetical protein